MPVRNERAFIDRSLGSVLAQDYPPNRIEVFVADGLSTDGTPGVVRGFQQRYPNVHLLENPGLIVASGLNEAVARARGDVLVRVDGHCEIAPDYVSRCVAHLERREAEGVGGFIETVGEDSHSRVIALAMSSSFGVGGALFRTTSGKTLLVDTVAFPAYTRDAVERAGPFDEELVRNQDDEYNYRLRSLGFRILLAADVRSRYYSRSSLRSLWRQYFQYGYWKVRVMQKHPRQMRPRQFVPLALVVYLLGSTLVAPLTPLRWVPLAIGASTYVGINIAASIWTGRRETWRALPLLSVAFAALHLSYGLGFLTGLARFAGRWGDRTTPRTSSSGQPKSVTGSALLPPEESLR